MSLPDLNLIRVFVILYETGSVTHTAERLHVTQPSVSYALSRLRELFDDRLFIRTHQAMEPTMTARQLYPTLKESLQQLENTIESRQHFTPEQCRLRFRLALTDLGEASFLPIILQHLHAQAPEVELEVIPLRIDRADEWLINGKVNAVICSRPIKSSSIERHVIAQDRYVCLGRPSVFHAGPLDLETFTSSRHVVVASTSGHSLAEEKMQELGIERKVSLEVPHFLILPKILRQNDLLGIVPVHIARQFAADGELCIHPLPFHVPDFDISLYWRSQAFHSPAQRWFCNTIAQAIASLDLTLAEETGPC
ncbi:MAG: LysR family transcriptional regulator [Halomonadaceae bacterium]|jgi:DNA-binding transcriptional LysR family regulator